MSPVCVSMWFTLIVPCDLESSDPLWKAGIWCCCSPQPSEPFSTLWLRGRNGLQWLGRFISPYPYPPCPCGQHSEHTIQNMGPGTKANVGALPASLGPCGLEPLLGPLGFITFICTAIAMDLTVTVPRQALSGLSKGKHRTKRTHIESCLLYLILPSPTPCHVSRLRSNGQWSLSLLQ